MAWGFHALCKVFGGPAHYRKAADLTAFAPPMWVWTLAPLRPQVAWHHWLAPDASERAAVPDSLVDASGPRRDDLSALAVYAPAFLALAARFERLDALQKLLLVACARLTPDAELVGRPLGPSLGVSFSPFPWDRTIACQTSAPRRHMVLGAPIHLKLRALGCRCRPNFGRPPLRTSGPLVRAPS